MKPGSITSVASGVATDYRGLIPTGTHEAVARIANRWQAVTNVIGYYWHENVYWVHIRKTDAHGLNPRDYDIPAECIDLLAPAAIF